MTIREAVADDIDVLVTMSARFLTLVYAGKIPVHADVLRAVSLRLMTSPDAVVYVAEHDGAVIGMMGLMRYRHPMSGEATVSEVAWWMNPDARGAGVRLFRAGEQWAKACGASLIQMIAPSPEVERFYVRAGYEPVERIYQRRLS